jgi:hypothetical protein
MLTIQGGRSERAREREREERSRGQLQGNCLARLLHNRAAVPGQTAAYLLRSACKTSIFSRQALFLASSRSLLTLVWLPITGFINVLEISERIDILVRLFWPQKAMASEQCFEIIVIKLSKLLLETRKNPFSINNLSFTIR